MGLAAVGWGGIRSKFRAYCYTVPLEKGNSAIYYYFAREFVLPRIVPIENPPHLAPHAILVMFGIESDKSRPDGCRVATFGGRVEKNKVEISNLALRFPPLGRPNGCGCEHFGPKYRCILGRRPSRPLSTGGISWERGCLNAASLRREIRNFRENFADQWGN